MRNLNILMAIGLIVLSTLTIFTNCSDFNESSANMSSVSPLGGAPVTTPGTTPPAGVSLFAPDGPVTNANLPPPQTPGTCTEYSPGLTALAASITVNAGAGNQGSTAANNGVSISMPGCQAEMNNFAANAVDASGNTINSVQVNQTALVGLFCPQSGGTTLDLYVFGLEMLGLRASPIATVYFCTAGTTPSSCLPTSASFIAGLTYGANGYQQFTNVAGQSGSTPTVDPNTAVSAIWTPNGGSYSDLGTCNTVQLRSPLIIEQTAGAGITTLNPFTTQTYFDLTGSGTEERISCVTGGAFLVLPNPQGQVIDIDQLFGNNTLGPDGTRAANGFVALGKYDNKTGQASYGTLTAADAVWSKLRLWQDTNCDGVAQASEFRLLSAWNITAIRWINALPVVQQDLYGNQTQEVNTAYQGSGSKMRVFDLWFMSFGTH